MANRPTLTNAAGISKYPKASGLSKKATKTITRTAIASAVVVSAFAFTATSASAARVRRPLAPVQQYCLSYSQGGEDCGFTSYDQCQASASGISAECYPNGPGGDEAARAQQLPGPNN
jgi:hypothetical protein